MFGSFERLSLDENRTRNPFLTTTFEKESQGRGGTRNNTWTGSPSEYGGRQGRTTIRRQRTKTPNINTVPISPPPKESLIMNLIEYKGV